MPTAEQVWRKAMPPDTELAAGRAGIYNGVSWVVTMRPTPPGFDRLRGNELAIVDVATVQALGVTLPFLVTSLAGQGVSALVVIGEVVPDAAKEADRLGLPLLRLPGGSNAAALETCIAALVAEERYQLYQREQELAQLMDLALAGEGVDSIMQRLEIVSGRRTVVLGVDFEPRGVPPEIPDVQKLLVRLASPPPAAMVGLKLTDRWGGFLTPVSGKQGVEGYLLVIAPSGDLQEADRLAARMGALAVAVEMSRDQAVLDTEVRFQSEMVESILSGDLPAQALNERAERLGLSLSQSYAVMAAQLATSQNKVDSVARKARAVLGQGICHQRGNTLVIIHPIAAPGTVADARRLGREVGRKLSDYLGKPVSLGIGRTCIGAAGLRVSLQEAEQALALGRRLFGDGSVNFFGDLGVYRLLLAVHPEEIKSFYQESVGQLSEYDGKHRGALLHTLEALLRYPTLAETAKALHVHRNTLLYRLQRIQEVTDLNLEDGETRLILHLALKARDVIRVS